MSDYQVKAFWSDEDGCYVSDIPELQMCSAFGDTPEEALAEVQQARSAWFETAREHGKPVPEPYRR